MSKPVIGIICQASGWNDDSPFTNRYYVLDNYIHVINKNGGIPIAIVMDNLQIIKESLDLCDGFIITGGTLIQDYHLQVIEYANQNNKPLLGICMGMQAIAIKSLEQKESEVLTSIIKPHNHNALITKSDKNKTIHQVKIINKESHLYQIFKKDIIDVNSFHNYQVEKIGPDYEIVGKSSDGIIEIIEHKDKNKFIVGVQWHPELLDSMQPLIVEFINRAGKNSEN